MKRGRHRHLGRSASILPGTAGACAVGWCPIGAGRPVRDCFTRASSIFGDMATPGQPHRASPTLAQRPLLALGLGGFGIGTGEFVTLGLLPNMAASLGVSVPRAGELISAYALGVVVGAPLLTGAAARLPRKGLLIGIALTLALGNVASALVPGFTSLLALRFLTAMPHGTYFGVASVLAGNLAPAHKRSSAMAVVFAGLTTANVVGVPLTTLIGQHSSWRICYLLVGAIELLAAGWIAVAVPGERVAREAEAPRLRHELHSFRQAQIWLSLGIAMIGGAALFASFSYIAPMMTNLAGYPSEAITPLLVIFGLGMTAGNLVGARLADRALMRTIYAALSAEVLVAAAFFFTARNEITAAVTIALFPFCALAILPALQSRIVALAGGAPNVAAASIHAAFNIANSLGAWLGGITIAAGLGYGAPNLVAAGLAALGLSVALISGRLERRVPHADTRSSMAPARPRLGPPDPTTAVAPPLAPN
jgi:MFS transporter, DHA1 family, inner membrane transport protein